ncbi:tetratricopeptide repeat-containing sensor histidine kinase [Microscilla marina]|uniref:histidine kinase n=1 Tax=Microscilla marina ATCC 23134 TaxID=313606 RepID=A1ZQP5_MICM2|nr:HAMP domain-containing sensor histidine kinase [Microscilla marina]EAY27199.1 conserved hypothetical protein [Microscilla marina ATCC 23134]
MKHFLCFCIICFLLSFSGAAQHIRLESKEALQTKLKALNDTDTSKVSILCALARKTKNDTSSLSLDYAKQALKTATLQKSKTKKIQAYIQLINTCLSKRKLKEAYEYKDQGEKVLQGVDDVYQKAMFWATLQKLHSRNGPISNPNKGMEYAQKALKLLDSVDVNHPFKIQLYNNITIFFGTVSKQDFFYLKKAVEIGKKYKVPPVSLARTYFLLGGAYTNLYMGGDLEKSFRCFKKSLSICDQLLTKYPNHPKLLEIQADSWHLLSHVYTVRQSPNLDSALYYCRQAINFRKQMRDPIIFESYLALAAIQQQQGKPTMALETLLMAKKLTVDPNYQSAVDFRLFQLYKSRKDYKTALYYANESFKSHAKQVTQRIESIDEELSIKYKTELKDKEIEIANAKSKAQAKEIQQKNTLNLLFALGALLMLLFVLYAVYVNRRTKKQNQLLSNQKEEIATQAEELQVVNNRLLELSQFKTDLSSMLVHDLKNPLNTIIGLASGMLITKTQQATIHQAGKSMLHIVNNMLDVHRLEEAELVPALQSCELNQLVTEALDNVRFVAQQKGVVLRQNMTTSLWIKADPDLMLRVLINLLTNAVKHSTVNTQVWVNASSVDQQMVEVCVKDEGVGIQLEKQQVIFEKFKGANPMYGKGSTGLGLAFVALVAKAHGGKVSVRSEENKGATFSVVVPVAPAQEVEKIVGKRLRPTPITQGRALPPIVLQCRQNLKNTEIYEASKILSILQKIDETSPREAQIWKEQIAQTVYNYNEKKYQELIKLAKE